MPKDIIAQLMKDTDSHMLLAIEALKREFGLLRTGRANPMVLDRVTVEHYGEQVPLKQVATISAPEPRMLMIQPWDKATIKPIIDAITSSDLGLNPSTDGVVIRIPLPQLTTERRRGSGQAGGEEGRRGEDRCPQRAARHRRQAAQDEG